MSIDTAPLMSDPNPHGKNKSELQFLQTRLNRAKQLRQRATRIFNNPIMKMLGL